MGIANGIMGLHRASGEVAINGKSLSLNNPRESLLSGLAFVSEDRRGVGLMLDNSIEAVSYTHLDVYKRQTEVVPAII